jgi:hypothetical protein
MNVIRLGSNCVTVQIHDRLEDCESASARFGQAGLALVRPDAISSASSSDFG